MSQQKPLAVLAFRTKEQALTVVRRMRVDRTVAPSDVEALASAVAALAAVVETLASKP